MWVYYYPASYTIIVLLSFQIFVFEHILMSSGQRSHQSVWKKYLVVCPFKKRQLLIYSMLGIVTITCSVPGGIYLWQQIMCSSISTPSIILILMEKPLQCWLKRWLNVWLKYRLKNVREIDHSINSQSKFIRSFQFANSDDSEITSGMISLLNINYV